MKLRKAFFKEDNMFNEANTDKCFVAYCLG